MGADLILRETHALSLFLSDSFYSLKPLPPRSRWYIKRSFRFYLYLYLPTAMILYYTVFHVGLQSSVNCTVFSSFRRQMLLCWVSGRLCFGGSRTRKRAVHKVQQVCGVELTCMKKVFLHLKCPAGRELDYAGLHALSSPLNRTLRCRLLWWRNQCYFSPAGVDVWS